MRKRKSNNRKLLLLLALVLGISIGYAALASNLKINGATGVKNASWIIHWANPQVAPGSVTETKPVLSESNTNATYSVTLSEPGDFYEFTIDAVNEGTIDAEILQIKSKFNGANGEDIITEGPNRNLPAYLEYEVTHADNEHSPITVGESLDHGQTETYRVRVAYSENINPGDLHNEDITTTFYFEIEYKQKDKSNQSTPSGDDSDSIVVVNPATPGEVTPGDKVVIQDGDDDETEQEFTVTKVEDNKVYLLAKYNLSTYATTKNSTKFYQYDDSPYIDRVGGISTNHDNVPFSKTAYWEGKVGTDYTEDSYYDPTYNAEPVFTVGTTCSFSEYSCLFSSEYGDEGPVSFYLDESQTPNNYSIAYYTENYKTILTGKGATIVDVRIPTEADVSSLVTSGALSYSGSNGFWLANYKYVDPSQEDSSKRIDQDLPFDVWGEHGVRPLVVVNLQDVK